MEWTREQYLDYMTGRRADRPMFVELFGLLVGLEDEWRGQGALEREIDLTAFGFDYVHCHSVGVETGFWPAQDEVVLEETSEIRVVRDKMGRQMKLIKKTATIPLPLDFPVTDEKDWLRLKPRYAFEEKRFSDGWAGRAREAREKGALIQLQIVGGYYEIRELMGDEEACVSFYTRPGLIRDMLATFEELNKRVLSLVSAEVQIDQISIHEDFAGKSGPIVGPNIIDGFIGPYYASAWSEAASNAAASHRGSGPELFQLDSDGNVTPIIDALLAAGINTLLPNEPAAGMDIVALHKRYGNRLRLLGGIDKHVLRASREAIDAELTYKLQPVMRQGGVVFGLDHRIPNGTPLANYRYYVKRVRDILGLEPTPAPGWRRMAL